MDGISLPAKEHELVLVTGPSGAGRTTAIRAFEDLGYEAGDFPVSEDYAGRVFSLPMHPYLTPEVLQDIVSHLRDACA